MATAGEITRTDGRGAKGKGRTNEGQGVPYRRMLIEPDFATFSLMKALLYAGLAGRVPVPPEKQFLISQFQSLDFAGRSVTYCAT
jgi:hypothetical protein